MIGFSIALSRTEIKVETDRKRRQGGGCQETTAKNPPSRMRVKEPRKLARVVEGECTYYKQ